MKATEQYFAAILFSTLFIHGLATKFPGSLLFPPPGALGTRLGFPAVKVLCKVVLTFEFSNGILICDHSNEN